MNTTAAPEFSNNENDARNLIDLAIRLTSKQFVRDSLDYVGLYKVIMVKWGSSKIQAIKNVREVTGLGLSESKAFCESIQDSPKIIKSNISMYDAKKIAESYGDGEVVIVPME